MRMVLLRTGRNVKVLCLHMYVQGKTMWGHSEKVTIYNLGKELSRDASSVEK